jgi:hypothetical protein
MLIELDGPIVFHRWIPDGQQDAIKYNENGIELRIWFDVECTWWASQPDREEIARTYNVRAHRVHVSACSNVSDALRDHIQTKSSGSKTSATNEDVVSEYQSLGRAIHKLTAVRLNSLIGYARAVKGQYWVEEMPYDEANQGQFYIRNHAKASFEDGEIYRFNPDSTVALVASLEEQKRLITAEEWERAQTFVLGNARPPMVGSLLASARELASKGHKRTALIEAVSALELKLHEFARERDKGLIPERIQIRLESEGLGNLIEKVGLRGAFGTVIPLILNEQEMPTEIIAQCRDAIEIRNNVVHNGQRNIEEQRLWPILAAIEECCSRLDQLICKKDCRNSYNAAVPTVCKFFGSWVES